MLLSLARRRAPALLTPLARALSTPAEQAEFRASVADFAAREIAPHAERVDKENSFPKDVNLWAKLGEFGLLGAP